METELSGITIRTEDEERICELICSAIEDETKAKKEYNELKGLTLKDPDSTEIIDRILQDEGLHKRMLVDGLAQKYNCKCLSSASKK